MAIRMKRSTWPIIARVKSVLASSVNPFQRITFPLETIRQSHSVEAAIMPPVAAPGECSTIRREIPSACRSGNLVTASPNAFPSAAGRRNVERLVSFLAATAVDLGQTPRDAGTQQTVGQR